MGKNLIQQRRGKGGPRYRSPSFNFKGEAKLPKLSNDTISGQIIGLVKCPGHTSPLMEVKYNNDETALSQAPEGVKIGDVLSSGSSAELKTGNVLALKNIPEGAEIFNIEARPGDGGKFVRSSGTFAKIVSKYENKIIVLLPSSKKRDFLPECRAAIGINAGGGRTEKPVLKAGNKFFAMKARNKMWPSVSGTSMNAVTHPFGGRSSHNKGRPTQAARSAPPGRKVGKIAPRRTGRKKR